MNDLNASTSCVNRRPSIETERVGDTRTVCEHVPASAELLQGRGVLDDVQCCRDKSSKVPCSSFLEFRIMEMQNVGEV